MNEQNYLDEYWMYEALNLANKAEQQGEVPVGALLVYQGECVAKAWNQVLSLYDPSAHAEILALRQAGQYFSNYRLPETTLYVTLEPCPMCVGALIHARIKRLVFGAFDLKTGAAGSAFQLLNDPHHNHQIEVVGGVLQEHCASQLSQFFKKRRLQKKADKAQLNLANPFA